MGSGNSKKEDPAKDGAVVAGGEKKFNQTYMLSHELGSGAFSVVRLAVHKVTAQQTAVKIITKKKLTEDDLTSLLTEIDLLKQLDHPHIIKLYEVFDEGPELYMVTELVEGGELFDRIVSKSHYTEKEARDFVKLFLQTMSYMHGENIVHRDLKPENLLLTSNEDDANLKIADFGFAKNIKDLSPNETACGTPGYVAPEILKGDSYGTEVDIWSMGVICYVLLAGYPPFYDEDQKKLFRKIKEGKYYFHDDYWAHISPEAIDLIRKMLCVNQKSRWTAVQLLQHPWIVKDDEALGGKDLGNAIVQMKKFNARRRLKAAADAVIMTNRIKNLTQGISRAALVNENIQKYNVVEAIVEGADESGPASASAAINPPPVAVVDSNADMVPASPVPPAP